MNKLICAMLAMMTALLLALPALAADFSASGLSVSGTAQQLGKAAMSAQAVGGAVGRNPISIVIPCHRCVGAKGQLTGYAGGLDRKRFLLDLESPRALLTNENQRNMMSLRRIRPDRSDSRR